MRTRRQTRADVNNKSVSSLKKAKKEILLQKNQKKVQQKGNKLDNKKVKVQSVSIKKKDEIKGKSNKSNTLRSAPSQDKQKQKNKKKQSDKVIKKPQPIQRKKTMKSSSPQVKVRKNGTSSMDDKKKKKSPEKEKVKTIIMKGSAPIDQHCQLTHKNYHVLEHNGKIYSATLNQTNVIANNNKYYILQIIQSDNSSNQCYFYTRWGRVGFVGQKGLTGSMPMNIAIHNYEQKYRDKHKNGNYRQIQLNYANDDDPPPIAKTKSQISRKQKKQQKQSKLPKQVKNLIELIFDINMMNRQMKEIGFNVNKMPLGKLSKDNIMRGYRILQQLLDQIKGQKRTPQIQDLTNDFYSYIPHDFGMQRMSNFILNTQQLVKKKIQMLEALTQIKVATTILSQSDQNQNKFDSNYAKLNRDIRPIDRSSSEFDCINQYLQTSHADTHRSYQLELVDLFELNDQRENVKFTKDISNKMLLWHGSRLTNYVGILSQGLRIAPPEAPVTGYMFGKGVYFADMSSKSANYCFTNPQSNTGILLLCEVALGNMNQKYHSDYYASNLPPNKNSTKGLGRTVPNEKNYTLLKGVTIPMGPSQPSDNPSCSLMYNEYIVYDIAQIRIKYLLRTKFNYK